MAFAVCALYCLERSPLACLAHRGCLLNVCRICFFVEEIRGLNSELGEETRLYETLGDGLVALHQLAKVSADDSAQGGSQGESEGCWEAQGSGQADSTSELACRCSEEKPHPASPLGLLLQADSLDCWLV